MLTLSIYLSQIKAYRNIGENYSCMFHITTRVGRWYKIVFSRSIYVYSEYKLKTDKKKFTYPQRVKKLVILFISIKIYVARGIYKGHTVFLSFALWVRKVSLRFFTVTGACFRKQMFPFFRATELTVCVLGVH